MLREKNLAPCSPAARDGSVLIWRYVETPVLNGCPVNMLTFFREQRMQRRRMVGRLHIQF
jgi:hypothetical protein